MPNKLYKILIILGIVAVLAAIPLFWFLYSAPKNLEVDFLSVGQGDSALIKTPYGQNILIDGGPDNSVIKRLPENLPFWDKKIDLMILTHPHEDHLTGLIDVLKRYDVKKVFYTGVNYDSPAYKEWLDLISKEKIPLIIIDKPQEIKLGENLNLDIIYPRESLAGKDVENLNNSSMVAKLNYKNNSILFTGDIEKEVESQLANKQVDLPPHLETPCAFGADILASGFNAPQSRCGGLKADILKAAHHGSDTSNTSEFLEKVNPEIIIIQSGKDNKLGLPSPRVIKRLERMDKKIYRNDKLGTIKIFCDENECSVKK